MTAAGDLILVIGEALIDIVETGVDVVEHVGGSPANVALGLARLGRPVELTTWIAADERSDRIRDHLAVSGVRLTAGSQAAGRTPTALARLDADGVADYTFDITWDPPLPAPSRPAGHVHIGSIATTMAPGAQVVTTAVTDHRATATISYDPNVRPSLMGERAEVLARVEELVALSDVVKASDEDIAWLTPGQDPAEVARHWVELGAALVVVTRGPNGALAATAAGDLVEVPSPVVAVADTVGAGDSFMSGLIDGLAAAGLLGAGARKALRTVDTETVRTVLSRGIATASITVSRPGANPPSIIELDAALLGAAQG